MVRFQRFDMVFGRHRGVPSEAHGDEPRPDFRMPVMLDPSLVLVEPALRRMARRMEQDTNLTRFYRYYVPGALRSLRDHESSDLVSRLFLGRDRTQAEVALQEEFLARYSVEPYFASPNPPSELPPRFMPNMPPAIRSVFYEEWHFLTNQSTLLSRVFAPIRALSELENVIVLKALAKLGALDPAGPSGVDVKRLKLLGGRWIVVAVDVLVRDKALGVGPVEFARDFVDVLVAIDP